MIRLIAAVLDRLLAAHCIRCGERHANMAAHWHDDHADEPFPP